MHLSTAAAMTEHLSGNHDRGIVALLLTRVCVADWMTTGRPARRTRFGSINALARSLGHPPETVRRHVRALAADGLVTADRGGVALTDDPAFADRITSFYGVAHDELIDFVAGLDRIGGLPRPREAVDEIRLAGAILTTALDISLMPFEKWRGSIGDWTSLILWTAMSAANVRHVMLDPVLDARYACEPVPDAERRATSLAALARRLRISQSTTWRHAVAMEKKGLMIRRDRRWIVTTAQYRDPALDRCMIATSQSYCHRVAELVTQGLDPALLRRRYLRDRPEPA